MEQSPSWEANQFSARQILHILWNLRVYYLFYKYLPPVPEMGQYAPYPNISLPKDPSQYYPPIYAWVFQVVLSLRFPH